MPSIPSNPMAIDREWAESLVGLRLKVPEHWWDGFSGNTESEGRIAEVDFEDAAERFFMLELDEEEGCHYSMRHDAVLHYADVEHSMLGVETELRRILWEF